MNNRRSLLGSLAALAVVPAATSAAPAVTLEPDAELIELCHEYCVGLDAYEACANADGEDGPLWQYLERMEAQIQAVEPVTLAGVAALAKVAAHWARQPDGTDDFSTPYTGDWPERVTRAVLRIAGGQT